MNALNAGIPQWGGTFMQFFTMVALCGLRLMLIMIIFPPTGDKVLQGTIRNGLVVLWSAFIALGQQAMLPELHGWHLVFLCIKEAVIGLLMAFVVSPVFWVAEAVGTYVDDLTGYNNVQMSNPSQGQQTTITSTLMSQCAIVAFWTLGGMTFLLGALYQSYGWWPLESATPVPAAVLATFAIHATDSLMVTVAKLAAPCVMLLLLVDFGLGLVGKTAQKLELNALAHPIKGALAVLMLALMIGIFIAQVRDQVSLVHVAAQLHGAPGLNGADAHDAHDAHDGGDGDVQPIDRGARPRSGMVGNANGW